MVFRGVAPCCRICGKDLGVQGKHRKITWAPHMATYVANRHMREVNP